MDCLCTNLVDPYVRLCVEHHKYWLGSTELASVSSVIKTVYNKKSWDGVDPAVIENARVRGSLVDEYFSIYVRCGFVDIPEGERMDVIESVTIAQKLFEREHGNRRTADAQVIVYSEDDGIAGTIDISVDNTHVVDLKRTYSPEASWILQLGAYLTYSGAKYGSIIHVSPKLYKNSGGGRIIKFNTAQAEELWFDAVQWWKRTKVMENAIKKA